MKHFTEFVQDFDGTYYANMTMGGTDHDGKYTEPHLIDLPQNVSWKKLKKAIFDATGVCILKRCELFWSQIGRKKYAYVDATQYIPGGDCRITLEQIKHGFRPDFS